MTLKERQTRCVKCNKVLDWQAKRKPKFKRRYRGYICISCQQRLWRSKGYSAERDFVNRARKAGYNAIRIPTSGAGQEDIPDVVLFKPPNGPVFALELKAIDGNKYKFFTIYAWKKDRKTHELVKGQLVKCRNYLEKMYPANMKKIVGVACKFILGWRIKSPWVIKFVPNPLPRSVTVSITDQSDMLEITGKLSARTRKIIMRMMEKRAERQARKKKGTEDQ